MSAADWVGLSALVVATIGALFTGIIQIKSLPRIQSDVTTIEKNTNNRVTQQDMKIAELERKLSELSADRLSESQAREGPR